MNTLARTWLGVLLVLAAGGAAADAQEAPARQRARAAQPIPLTGIGASFRLDPRLTRSLYLGDRWVSPKTYSRVQDGKTLVVEARAVGHKPRGRPVPVPATWTSDRPEVLSVAPPRGPEVVLTAHRLGRARLVLAFGPYSKAFAVEVVRQGGALRVDITAEEAAAPAPPEGSPVRAITMTREGP